MVYDTAQENDLVWGTGLGCQGEVKVFFERLPSLHAAWLERLRENFAQRRDTQLRIVYEARDARALGTRLPEGEWLGQGDLKFVEECIAAPPSIVIFGAGDDAMPLVEFAGNLGWHVAVLDTRAAYATRERFPQAHHVRALDADVAANHPGIDRRSHVIVMSHRYRSDLAFLRAVLPREIAYLGVLGPRQRTQRILEELASEGAALSTHLQERLYAPVGLDLGGASPETVALSIISELQAIQSGRTPGHLRDSQRPIHGP